MASRLDAVEEGEKAAFEDLAHVDIAQLAIEPAQQSLGFAPIFIVVATGDLLERLAAAGDAKADRAREVGVQSS